MSEQYYEYFTDINTGREMAIETATGNVIDTVNVTAPIGTRFYTPAQQRAYIENREIEANRQLQRLSQKELPFGYYYFISSDEQFKDLTPETVTRLIYLNTFALKYNSRQLMLTERTPMKRNDLIKVLGVSKATTHRFWKEVSPTYLTEDCNGVLLTNNNIFIKGKIKKGVEDNPYLKIYINGVRKLYRSTDTSNHKHLGYIFKLLPFINIEYNVLCFNPLEKDIESIEPLSLSNFCDLIGYNHTNLHRLLYIYRKLYFDVNNRRERFCSFVYNGVDKNNSMICINPHILYSGSNYKNVEALGLFYKE